MLAGWLKVIYGFRGCLIYHFSGLLALHSDI